MSSFTGKLRPRCMMSRDVLYICAAIKLPSFLNKTRGEDYLMCTKPSTMHREVKSNLSTNIRRNGSCARYRKLVANELCTCSKKLRLNVNVFHIIFTKMYNYDGRGFWTLTIVTLLPLRVVRTQQVVWLDTGCSDS